MDRYIYSYIENGARYEFAAEGISANVAKGLRTALGRIPGVTDVQAERIRHTTTATEVQSD